MKCDKILSLISLSKKAGFLFYGYDSVIEKINLNNKGLLILSEDLAENTRKKLLNDIKNIKLSILHTNYKKDDFFNILKKQTGILYVLDEGLSNAITNHYNTNKGE